MLQPILYEGFEDFKNKVANKTIAWAHSLESDLSRCKVIHMSNDILRKCYMMGEDMIVIDKNWCACINQISAKIFPTWCYVVKPNKIYITKE